MMLIPGHCRNSSSNSFPMPVFCITHNPLGELVRPHGLSAVTLTWSPNFSRCHLLIGCIHECGVRVGVGVFTQSIEVNGPFDLLTRCCN